MYPLCRAYLRESALNAGIALCAADTVPYRPTSTCASLSSSSHSLDAPLSCTPDSSAVDGQVHPGAAGRTPARRLASESVNAFDPPPPQPAARIATAITAAPRTAAVIALDRPTLWFEIDPRGTN